ncbi:MAG: nucleotidyl transferase AbiEii/AbiGii toxin family protein [Candidatus Sumerlaeia bacterium]|nr:nucleotidyl transferase AbiEii/AbiGii toxin family protein [Candidatus Sumerlaeia bacterium]
MAGGQGRDIGASVRARLRNLAGDRGEDFEFLLGRYAIESLLRRLTASAYQDRFVLKGAMLFVLWGIEKHRVTRDVDFLGFGDMSPEVLAQIFREVVANPVIEDGVYFLSDSVTSQLIREQDRYGGTRIHIRAVIARAEVIVQIDVGVGDDAPGCEMATFPTLLDGIAPVLRAYTPVLSIAEKCHAMVEFGIANSRMKDYFDILLLSASFRFELERLGSSIRRTFIRRGTALPSGIPVGLSDEYGADHAKSLQWKAFLRKTWREDVPHDLDETVKRVAAFLLPPLKCQPSHHLTHPLS